MIFRRKEVTSKLDEAKAYKTNQGKELPHDGSQKHKVMGSGEEAISNTVDGRRDRASYRSTRREERHCRGRIGQSKDGKKIPLSLKNKANILQTSREDEGARLALTADFSSATLNISKQWS